MNKNYVIIINKKNNQNKLFFCGVRSKDNENRNFNKCIDDFNSCERYSLKEIKNSNRNIPVYGKEINKYNYKDVYAFAIEIRRLNVLGIKTKLLYYYS